MIRPVRRVFAALVCLLLAGLPAAAARAQVIHVQLRDADGPETARVLSRALRAPVELRGGDGRRLSLSFAAAAPSTVLDRVSAALGGRWRMKLRVSAGGRPVDPEHAPILERNFAVGLQDVTAARAFALIARELKAELELEGALDTRVTVLAVNAPARVLLDRIADQAGAAWSIVYGIELPDAPAASRRDPEPAPARPPVPPAVPVPAPAPVPAVPPPAVPPRPASPAAPSGAAIRAALWDGINDVVRVPPDQRAEAVREFIRLGERLVASLAALPAEESRARFRAILPLRGLWKRLYDGLAPNVREELTPVTRFLDRALPR